MCNFQVFYKQKLSNNKRRDIIIIFSCLEAILAFSYFGYFDIEPISITTMPILVIVASMLFDYKGAIPVSLVFAFTSLWKASSTATQYQDIIFSPFRSGDPISSLLLIIPRILFGLFSAYLFSLYFKKERKKPYLGISIIAIIASFFHSSILSLFMKILFNAGSYDVSNMFLGVTVLTIITVLIVCLSYTFFNSEKIKKMLLFIDEFEAKNKLSKQEVLVFVAFFVLIIAIVGHYLSKLSVFYEVLIDYHYLLNKVDGQLLLQFVYAIFNLAVIFLIIVNWANDFYAYSGYKIKENQRQLDFEKEMNDALKREHELLQNQNIKLEKTMDQLRINYEIILAISTLYTIIYRIDLIKKQYEQIKGYDDLTSVIGKTGAVNDSFGTYFKEFVSEQYREDFIKFLDLNTVADRLNNIDSLVFQYRSSNYKWKEVSFIVKSKDENNNVTSVLLLVKDIDKQKQLELEYQSAIEALARDYTAVYVVDLKKDTIRPFSAKKGSFSYDLQAKHVDCYKSYSYWIDYDFKHFVVHDSFPDYVDVLNKDNLIDKLSANDIFVIRYDTIPNPCGLRKFEVRFIKILESDDSFKTILAYRFIDDVIKKEQEQNEQLRKINEELSKQKLETELANSAKTNFLRRMSHDIRTPINGIRGITEIANHFPEDIEKQSEYRQKILTSSDYLLALVNNILDMSKLESGQVKLVDASFDLKDVLNQCIEVAKMYGAETCINIHTDFSSIKHNNLIGSSVHFRQIINNIISNAIKYNVQAGDIYFNCLEDNFDNDVAYFTFTCKDTGLGMSKEFQEHLFEPFSQEDDGARTSYKGSGLGMSIAKELCELMGGSLSFESELNKGSTFIIKLPFKLDKKHEVTTNNDSSDDLNGIRILLVEDNKLNMEIAEFMLKDKGAILDKADDGLKAIDKFEKGKYDLILMDIMMPNMDGYTATAKIRQIDKDIPIIAMSANAFLDDIEKSLKMGMNDHVTKPLDVHKLINIINKLAKK